MSKEKGCKCCKQIWYEDMLDKKWKLCPNCYEYCKPLFDDLKIKDKQIANIQHRLKVAEKALTKAVNDKCFAEDIIAESFVGKGAKVAVPKKEQWYLE